MIFLSLGFLFKTLREGNKNSFISASALGSLIIYTHPWTFAQYYLAVVMSTVLSFFNNWRKGKEQKHLKTMISYITILAFAELIKSQFLNLFGGISATSVTIKSLSGLGEFWFSSIYNFRFLYGGFMSNVLLLGLALVGINQLKHEEPPQQFVTVLLALTSMVFIFGNEIIKSRLLFNIPIGLLASLGFLYIRQRFQNQNIRYVFTIFTMSSMLVYLLQSLANLI